MSRPPFPPFTAETAAEKARLAEDAWNSRDPARVALAYTPDSRWRNRSEFVEGREAIEAFLKRKWTRELDYRLIKEVWAFRENRIAVRFAYECHDDSGNWFRSLRQRELGVRRARPNAASDRQHQRSANQGKRAQISLAARTPARWPSRAQRSRLVIFSRQPSPPPVSPPRRDISAGSHRYSPGAAAASASSPPWRPRRSPKSRGSGTTYGWTG